MSSKWKKAILKRPPSRGSGSAMYVDILWCLSQLLEVQVFVKKVAVFSATKNPLTEADMLYKKLSP